MIANLAAMGVLLAIHARGRVVALVATPLMLALPVSARRAARARQGGLGLGARAKPLVVGGARELAAVLRRELGRGREAGRRCAPATIRTAPRSSSTCSGTSRRRDDERGAEARAACAGADRRRGTAAATTSSIPFVLATDVVRVGAGQGFPLEAIARMIAARLGEEAAPLAGARAAATRRGLRAARRRASPGATASSAPRCSSPAPTCPCLALNQLRLRAAARAGLRARRSIRASALPEIARHARRRPRAARRSRGSCSTVVPVAGWAVKGAVAYAGTRALGEAAVRRLEAASRRPCAGRSRRPRAGASRGGP